MELDWMDGYRRADSDTRRARAERWGRVLYKSAKGFCADDEIPAQLALLKEAHSALRASGGLPRALDDELYSLVGDYAARLDTAMARKEADAKALAAETRAAELAEEKRRPFLDLARARHDHPSPLVGDELDGGVWAKALQTDTLLHPETIVARMPEFQLPLSEMGDVGAPVLGLLPYDVDEAREFRVLVQPHDTHLLTVMGTRGGKGATHIVPNLMLYGGSSFVLDAVEAGKADGNYEICAAYLMAKGHRVVRFNPFDPNTEDTYNLLDALPERAEDPGVHQAISVLADYLLPNNPTDKKYFRDRAINWLAALIEHVRYSGSVKDDACNMATIAAIAQSGALGIASALGNSTLPSVRDVAIEILNDDEAGNADVMGNVISTLRNALAVWQREPIARNTAKSSFDPKDMKARMWAGERPMTVFFQVPLSAASIYASVMRSFTGAFIESLKHKPLRGEDPDRPVMVYLDEFANLGRLEPLFTAYNEIAKYGVRLWAFVQGMEGLRQVYGQHGVETFRQGGTVIFGSSYEASEADWMAKFIGKLPEEELRYQTRTYQYQDTEELEDSTPRYLDADGNWVTASPQRKKRMVSLPSEHVRHVEREATSPARMGALPDHLQMAFIRGRAPVLLYKFAHFDPLFEVIFKGADPDLRRRYMEANGADLGGARQIPVEPVPLRLSYQIEAPGKGAL